MSAEGRAPAPTAGTSRTLPDGGADRVARARLSRVAEPGDELVWHLVQSLGAPAVLAGITDGSLGGEVIDGRRVPESRVEAWKSRVNPDRFESDDAAAVRSGLRLVVPGDSEWPTSLDQLAAVGDEPASVRTAAGRVLVPPLVLWIRGSVDIRGSCLRSVTVVGARAATGYGEHVAAELGFGLAERGFTVVSGAAYGIDAAAHRGALAGGAPTLAVVACGADVAYPRGHEGLLARIASAGAVLSELPPGAATTRSRLLQRNRLVAALTRGTVVVEAAMRSGTRTTARYALRLGRHVMAVPGPVTSSASAGCHAMLKPGGGAVLVTDAEDIADLVGDLGRDAAQERRGDERPGDGLGAAELAVFDALPVRGGAGPASIAAVAGLDLPSVRSALGALVLKGLAEPLSGGFRLSAAARGSRAGGGS